MANKSKSFSHIEAQDALERLNENHPSGKELIYDLLRIFCNYGDGSIRRIREGVGNKAKDGKTILIPNVIAYRPKDSLDYYEEIKSMQDDPKVVKHSPRLYVVSDGSTIVALDPKEGDVYENEVALMWKDFDFFYPLAGIEKFRNTEEAEADVKSAELMAKIFDEIRRHNDVKDPTEMHNLNVFMSRLLFCFFAEDTKLFPIENLFTNSIRQHTDDDGHDLADFIGRAFLAMSTNDPSVRDALPKQFSDFPYVNGGLFQKQLPIPVLSRRTRLLIIKCGSYNWADINPDIFGSMIQAVVTPEMRAGLGMHYTSVPNIMKLIQPLFLDELRDEFTVARDTKDVKRLRRLLARLGRIKFFDPACGSGNFLIVTYKRIRLLEIDIWQALRKLGAPELPLSNISLQQFYGIEIDDFACDTATLSLWLAEHQMNIRFEEAFGIRPNALPLRPSGHIVCGNACRVKWEEVCPHTAEEEVYVMGNPPYLGTKWQDEKQKSDVDIAMLEVPTRRTLDYIACWFVLGTKYIRDTNSELAFVSTNSICQGEQVASLWPILLTENLFISFCHTSFKWGNNAKKNAGVTCVIIGLSTKKDRSKYIYIGERKNKAELINPYLTEGPIVYIRHRSKPLSNLPIMVKGSQPTDGGFLLMEISEYNRLIGLYPNLRPFIREYMGADDLINGSVRYCLWLHDCNDPAIFNIPDVKIRLEKVAKTRSISTKAATRKLASTPHLFTENRQPLTDYLILPVVSSERRIYIPVAYNSCNIIANTNTQMIPSANNFVFGVVTSLIHNIWMKAVCGRLELRYAYSASIVYNNFPFPEVTNDKKDEISALSQRILDLRDQHFDMTLGEMYNPESMPEDLKEAHHILDLAVERCYRLEPFTSDEERLEYLFKLYVKMTKK